MIICGVSFKIPQNNLAILTRILQGIDIRNYSWDNELSQEEAYLRDENGSVVNKPLFDKKKYNGEEFYNQIQKPHMIIFLKLGAYNDTAEGTIKNYKDFEESNCELLILIHDCEYVEAYIKNQDCINIMINNCVKNGFSDIKLISEETRRTSNMEVR